MGVRDSSGQIFRAQVFHTPRNPFLEENGLETFFDGAIAVAEGRIVATGEYTALHSLYPDSEVTDLRPGILLPGFVDTHVHFPQLPIIGAMGLHLIDWLKRFTLPAEAKMASPEYARRLAKEFLLGMLRNGTTSVLVFGSHFPEAQEILFSEASSLGLRIASGLVVSDQNLVPSLHQSPEQAYDDNTALIKRWHGKEGITYAVTPRFALSTSEAMLEVVKALVNENPGVGIQTHVNETAEEISGVKRNFPWAKDYLAVYEKFELIGPNTVLAHNVYPTASELERLAEARASIAHCPSSNCFLGSGLFPMRQHLENGVDFGLGSDVGAGTGFGILKEGLMAYQVQMLRPDGHSLTPTDLLYLATVGGARAMGLHKEVGDLIPGKRANMVLVKPPEGSTLASVLSHADSPEEVLGALFTLAGEESIAEVFLAGKSVVSRHLHNS